MYCMSILRVHTLHNKKSAKTTTLRVVSSSLTSLLPFENRISCAPTAFPKFPGRSLSFSESESVEGLACRRELYLHGGPHFVVPPCVDGTDLFQLPSR